ncbi:tyrosine-type recombinase/integrase [Fodinicola feengrottensis]|uniref:tyrosine-type recombinase/integrase n=1 Tax=Fodinicola feengrottensis TaxID=435914 RepID=UPI0031D317D3
MKTTTGRSARSRGSIEILSSGSLRVKVYAGIDPVSKRRHDLTEVIPAGPNAWDLAEKALTRLLNELDEQRAPKTSATVRQLLERHLDLLSNSGTIASGTVGDYRRYVRLHIDPLIGHLKLGQVDAFILDSLYAELARCREHCDKQQRSRIQHRTTRKHKCDEHKGRACSPADPTCDACKRLCRKHKCQPLKAGTIRKIHYLLSGAYQRAVRWKWIGVSPISQAEPPSAPPPDPQPPTAEEAARIINAAWLDGGGHEDPDFGTYVWLAMISGARRGELCAVRRKNIDLDRGVLVLRRAVAKDENDELYIKDTKTHQRRHIVLDAVTVDILREHLARLDERADQLKVAVSPEAFVFSTTPDHSEHVKPASVSQRYRRLVARLGIDTELKSLRHYSATELIAGGVDVRTVAGRLGHSGGGVTTLKVYSAWLQEADQRASVALSNRVPARPTSPKSRSEQAKTHPLYPYERIAADFREKILSGSIMDGTALPTIQQIAEATCVSVGTAHRAVALLKDWGVVTQDGKHISAKNADREQ